MDRSKRNRRGMLVGAVAVAGVALAVAGCGSSSSSSSSSTSSSSSATSTGSGSSFAALAYNTWCQNSKLCSYTSKGSAGGIQDFINGVVSWGATDSPLKPAELQQLASARGGVTPVYFPTFLGAIAVPTNVTGAKSLQFSGATLAAGFLLALFETATAKMRVFRVPAFLGAALMLGLLGTLLLFVSRSL